MLTSFPCDLRKSISSGVKLAIDIDFTRCGGFSPRLELIVRSSDYFSNKNKKKPSFIRFSSLLVDVLS